MSYTADVHQLMNYLDISESTPFGQIVSYTSCVNGNASSGDLSDYYRKEPSLFCLSLSLSPFYVHGYYLYETLKGKGERNRLMDFRRIKYFRPLRLAL